MGGKRGTAMKKLNLAIIGCGNISGIYLKNITAIAKHLNLYAVADLIPERVNNAASEYNVPHIMTDKEIAEDPNIDIVLNITTPPDHYELSKMMLEGGKHVYSEKPLALTYAEGKELVELAEKKGLKIGCAPDTFMGAGYQTAKKAIDDGMIGDVIGASAFMMCHGHEHWHPNPEFYYKKGGGPMFDMGPYYLTALVDLIGNVKSVMGQTSIANPIRTISSEPKKGQTINVEVPTYVNGLLKFENGALGTITTAFDVWGSNHSNIEIYGTKGTLYCPDPNCFDGDVLLQTGFGGRDKLPYVNDFIENSRSIGLDGMAGAIINGDTCFSANGKQALHVLEIMEKVHTSCNEKKEIELESKK